MVRRKLMRRSMREKSHEHNAGYFLPATGGRKRGAHCLLHAKRARSSLARSAVLYLLPDHGFSVLVAIHVLACSVSRGGTDGTLLASVVRHRVHHLHGLDVQDVGPRYANHRRRPALVEGDGVLR